MPVCDVWRVDDQIKKAYRLADRLDLDAEEVLERHSQEESWGEMLQAQREEQGKLPWANQGPRPQKGVEAERFNPLLQG